MVKNHALSGRGFFVRLGDKGHFLQKKLSFFGKICAKIQKNLCLRCFA